MLCKMTWNQLPHGFLLAQLLKAYKTVIVSPKGKNFPAGSILWVFLRGVVAFKHKEGDHAGV